MMNKQIFIVSMLSFVSFYAIHGIDQRMDNVASERRALLRQGTIQRSYDQTPESLYNASQNWSNLNAIIRQDLNESNGYRIIFDDTITKPQVDLSEHSLKIPPLFNKSVDTHGINAENKFELYKAFGYAHEKDAPFAYWVKRPRPYTAREKDMLSYACLIPLISGACLTASALTDLIIYDCEAINDECSSSFIQCTIGYTLMNLAVISVVYGIYESDGKSFYLSRESKRNDDALEWAVKHMPLHDLQVLHNKLRRKKCSLFRDWLPKRLIEAQVKEFEQLAADEV
jgi:hypothetical protein